MLVLRKVAATFVSFLLIFVIFFLLFVSHVGAQQAQNIYGIHISDKEDIPHAASLVNGDTGAWGYVTIVITSDDRKIDKWQPIFHDLIKYELQPIVRIATKVDGNNWTRPTAEDAQAWADFLASLYWPTDQRIVSIYNEVNHGREWGGSTDPRDYARVLNETIEELNKKDPRFFVLQAAFDQSTPHQPPQFYDQLRYMEEMEQAVPGIFNKLDGWASHSYPNPGFAGRPEDNGRRTIRGYEWELEMLKSRFGVSKELPVYIKETGWPYKNTHNPQTRYTLETAQEFIVKAYTDVWMKDSRVVAVTPFLLRYKGEAFSHFSWLTLDNKETSMFQAVKAIAKQRGSPQRSYIADITRIEIPAQVPYDREITALVTYRNSGSTAWNARSNVQLTTDDPYNIIVRDNFRFTEEMNVMPGQSYTYRFQIKVKDETQKATLALQLQSGDQPFGEKLYTPLSVYRPPTLALKAENPPSKEISSVVVGMKDARGNEHIFDASTLPTNGDLGSFEHPAFSPGVPLNVVLSFPRRNNVSLIMTPKEGENMLTFSVPPEKSAFVLFAENFARALRRS